MKTSPIICCILISAVIAVSGCVGNSNGSILSKSCDKDEKCLDAAFNKCAPATGEYWGWSVTIRGLKQYERTFMHVQSGEAILCEVNFKGDKTCAMPEEVYMGRKLWEAYYIKKNCYPGDTLPTKIEENTRADTFSIPCSNLKCANAALHVCTNADTFWKDYTVEISPDIDKSICSVHYIGFKTEDWSCKVPFNDLESQTIENLFDSGYCKKLPRVGYLPQVTTQPF